MISHQLANNIFHNLVAKVHLPDNLVTLKFSSRTDVDAYSYIRWKNSQYICRVTLTEGDLKECSVNDLKGMIGHELGHVVMHHNDKKLDAFDNLFMLASYRSSNESLLLFTVVGLILAFIIDILLQYFLSTIASLFIQIFICVLMSGFVIFILSCTGIIAHRIVHRSGYAMFQHEELNADGFGAKLVGAKSMIHLLAHVGKGESLFTKFLENHRLATHPSLNTRIKHLQKLL